MWLAVRAHLRHAETAYDQLLSQGCARQEARTEVEETIEQVLASRTGAE